MIFSISVGAEEDVDPGHPVERVGQEQGSSTLFSFVPDEFVPDEFFILKSTPSTLILPLYTLKPKFPPPSILSPVIEAQLP